MKNTRKIVTIFIIAVMTILILNITVKANSSLKSSLYTIDESNKLIERVIPNTSLQDFKSKLIEKNKITVYTDKTCVTEIINGNMKTGMAVKYENTIYAVSVIGDINGDGKVSLTDLNKIINYYLKISINTAGDYELSGEYLAAANIANGNTEITITDIDNIIATITNGDIPEQCKPIDNGYKEITNIEIVKVPNKVDYKQGERLDLSGLEIKIIYSDGSVQNNITTDCSADIETLNTVGANQKVKIYYKQDKSIYAEITVNVTANDVLVTEIKLNETTLELIPKETAKLSAEIVPANATDKKISWESSNSNIAKVDDNGTIEAIAIGETTITAKCGDQKASCKVYVMGIQITDANGNNIESSSILVNESITLKAKVLPESLPTKNIKWKKNVDDRVEIVSTSGHTCEVQGKAPDGSLSPTIVTAYVDGYENKLEANCKVLVREVNSIVVKTNPVKTEYVQDEKLEIKGLTIELTYTDNTKKIIDSGFTTNPKDGETLNNIGNEIPIKVMYDKLETTFNVKVNAKPQTITASMTQTQLENDVAFSFSIQSLNSALSTIQISYAIDNETAKTKIFGLGNADDMYKLNPGQTISKSDILLSNLLRNGNRYIFYIDATNESGGTLNNYEITYTRPQSISLNITRLNMVVGTSRALIPNIFPANTESKAIIWESTNSNIVQVNEYGVVMAKQLTEEPIIITAKALVDNRVVGKCTVNVTDKKVPITNLKLNVDSIYLRS